ncbi:hypothetical protein CDCA_CDCA17G4400 [Cyanidium caldarium]|uniref:CRA domain-containing protein n=1 Tax=Cyanidium caldarium TaxID=2771 RepID=A0AAV9J212_CYACA|nr:hypothetical protein CDCA_CDCA17G4400 [Cyanidium caldarium]
MDRAPPPDAPTEERALDAPVDAQVSLLVLRYLVEECHEATARALHAHLQRDLPQVPELRTFPGYDSMRERRRLRDMIVREGRVHEAVKLADLSLSSGGAGRSPDTSEATPPEAERSSAAGWSVKELDAPLAFYAYLQQFVEYVRAREPEQAIQYARQHLQPREWAAALAPSTATTTAAADSKRTAEEVAWRDDMSEALALLAYEEPECSPVASLLNTERRYRIADGLNQLMLRRKRASEPSAGGSALERHIRHAGALLHIHQQQQQGWKDEAPSGSSNGSRPLWSLSQFLKPPSRRL